MVSILVERRRSGFIGSSKNESRPEIQQCATTRHSISTPKNKNKGRVGMVMRFYAPRGPVWRRRLSPPFAPPPPAPPRFPDILTLFPLGVDDDLHTRSLQLLPRQSESRLQSARNPSLADAGVDVGASTDPLGGLDVGEGPADGSKDTDGFKDGSKDNSTQLVSGIRA
jgi:hypothetical protein